MAKGPLKPRLPMPSGGGSSIRDPKTGALKPNVTDPAAATPPKEDTEHG